MQKNLKKLNQIMRSPYLCDMYLKRQRSMMTQKEIARANLEAYNDLRLSSTNEAGQQNLIITLLESIN